MSHFFSLVQLEREAMRRHEMRNEFRELAMHGDAYRDHCLMMKLFPGLQGRWENVDQTERTQDFVFRRRTTNNGSDQSSASPAASFYVVSRERPEPVSTLLSVKTKEYQPKLQTGEGLRFQLRANPSVTRSRGDVPAREAGRHKPHHDVLMLAKKATQAADAPTRRDAMNEAALEWLLSRAPTWGLMVDPGSLLAEGYTQHRLRRRNSAICFSSIDYTGTAKVTDPALLKRALLEGVGRKRGFGCGLLLVQRLT